MGLQHFSHEHPLVFNEEQSHESEKVYCSGCGELVSGPSFSCLECGFYLDKQCAEAPSEMNNPFHHSHSLNLLVSSPYQVDYGIICDLCGKKCHYFVYHCSCNLDLHVKCAFFSKDIAEKRLGALEDIPHKDPLTSPENCSEEVKEDVCFACYKPLSNTACVSLDSGFRLHKKCVDLSTEINHFSHSQHPLILQFNSKPLPCQICQRTQDNGFIYCCSHCEIALHITCVDLPNKIDHPGHTKHPLFLQIVNEPLLCQICHETQDNAGFVYYCSICKFSLHIECASPPPTIETKSHQHPFTLFWRYVSFICDACGNPGRYVCYICSTCGLIVHKKCTSIPHTLKHPVHPEHPISHTYFVGQYELESWQCRICHLEEVASEHGGYYCSDCNYIAHVNCAIEDYNWYDFDESCGIDENLDENSSLPLYSIITETKEGENVLTTEIKHFNHQHNLVLSNDINDDKCCDGCVLSVSTSYYYCTQCDFCLHKACAELPRKKHIWFHHHTKPFSLTSYSIFRCNLCEYETSGFAYTCNICKRRFCLRCALVSDRPKREGHEHPVPLLYKSKYKALCSACGDTTTSPYGCKRCNFYLDGNCFRLPLIARHKYDEHPFKLTYHEDNSYSACHYCDICENQRNPSHWFYHCAICDNSAHPDCVLGKYSFIKLGSIYKNGDHPHPLTFVQKVHYYPECLICGKPCLDLSLKCKATGCGYIAHWECIKPRSL